MALDVETMMPFAVFLAMTLGAWAVLGMAAGRPKSAEDRLRRLLDPRAGVAGDAGQAKKQEIFQAKVTAAAKKLGQSLRPNNAQELGKIRIKLLNAGFRQEQAVAVYYGSKFIGLMLGLGLAFPPCCYRWGMT